MSFFKRILHKISDWLIAKPVVDAFTWCPEWSDFLLEHIVFYRVLSDTDKKTFEHRCLLFMNTTRIEAGAFDISDADRLLVASSAIIPVWGFPDWHYFNLDAVFLLPAPFNDKFECGREDSLISGMVGTGPMAGKMALSRPDLHYGFENSRDKRNVGIHEFVHMVDMADGRCDGLPEHLHKLKSTEQWFSFIEHKIHEIDKGKSNIDDYGATNRQEFFAVASEYFFERPAMLQRKHPKLFDALTTFYQQDVLDIAKDIKLRSKSPCPCGSGKRYKRCCMPNP